jgi:hypothetical protein
MTANNRHTQKNLHKAHHQHRNSGQKLYDYLLNDCKSNAERADYLDVICVTAKGRDLIDQALKHGNELIAREKAALDQQLAQRQHKYNKSDIGSMPSKFDLDGKTFLDQLNRNEFQQKTQKHTEVTNALVQARKLSSIEQDVGVDLSSVARTYRNK